MVERKSILWFLAIAFAISWILFLMPLSFQRAAAEIKQLVVTIFFAAAMWGPGIAAIVVTLFVEKKPFKSLRLNTLGPKRFYLWAWFLPPVISILAGVFTVILGMGELDLNFSLIRDSLAAVSSVDIVPAWIIVAVQVAVALTIAPFINVVFALGEELGWRGFLLGKLMPLGQWKAIVISGAIWGIWHAPAIVQGLNYPGYPVLGIGMMVVFTVLLGTIFSWLYLKTRSPWVAALAHGSINASGSLPVLFLKPGFNFILGGTIVGLVGWLPILLFIAWLIWTKRMPLAVNETSELALEGVRVLND